MTQGGPNIHRTWPKNCPERKTSSWGGSPSPRFSGGLRPLSSGSNSGQWVYTWASLGHFLQVACYPPEHWGREPPGFIFYGLFFFHVPSTSFDVFTKISNILYMISYILVVGAIFFHFRGGWGSMLLVKNDPGRPKYTQNVVFFVRN